MVMAFIRRSGHHARCSRRCAESTAQPGRELRVLTTTYTGSTEARARLLRDLGAEVRVSYDTSGHAAARQGVAVPPRLGLLDGVHRLVQPHALGAGQTGLEWNVRVGARATPT
jgi:hypothetical protein